MISIVSGNNSGIKEFLCDKADELEKINLRATRMGSKCFIIENSKTYILDGEGKWQEIKIATSSSDSSSQPSEEETYI